MKNTDVTYMNKDRIESKMQTKTLVKENAAQKLNQVFVEQNKALDNLGEELSLFFIDIVKNIYGKILSLPKNKKQLKGLEIYISEDFPKLEKNKIEIEYPIYSFVPAYVYDILANLDYLNPDYPSVATTQILEAKKKEDKESEIYIAQKKSEEQKKETKLRKLIIDIIKDDPEILKFLKSRYVK